MWTIEKILGNRPTKEETQAEFNNRGLNLKDYEIIVSKYKCNRKIFSVHGFQSTGSSSPEEALMKHMIVTDENFKCQKN